MNKNALCSCKSIVKRLTVDKKKSILSIQKKDIYKVRLEYIYHCGDVSGEVPPVLIPNTEVKLTSADNTLLETAREDRLLLHPIYLVLIEPNIAP